jgi:uncharacterized protein (TIGR03083 family)
VTVSIDLQVAGCLRAIATLSGELENDVRALSAAAWDGPTNCDPWRVRHLAAHVVSSGEGFVASIRRGLAGSVEPAPSQEARHHRETELAAAGPETVAQALNAVTVEFIGLYHGLDDRQLATICYHRRGNRSVRWYAAHRLAEVAFHGWDLWLSLGRSPQFDDSVAALLLPTLLESNAPRTYAAGLTPERGRGERYALVVADDLETRWVVTIAPEKLDAVRGHGPADLTITGSAAELALLVYGRADLLALTKSGAVRLEGDSTLAERFVQIFPRP